MNTPTITTDRLLKLRDIEQALAPYFHPDSRPSRNTIIGWIEEGLLLGTKIGSGNNYYVWETSLKKFQDWLINQAGRMAA